MTGAARRRREAAEHADFPVQRAEGRQSRAVTAAEPPDPGPGQVLLRVDPFAHPFALTASNVTYALTGDMLASRHDGLPPGDRVFGFLPMSTLLVIDAGEVQPAQLADVALVYRQSLADQDGFGARTVVVSSVSSMTAIAHCGDNVKHSCVVGGRYRRARRPARDLPGAPPHQGHSLSTGESQAARMVAGMLCVHG